MSWPRRSSDCPVSAAIISCSRAFMRMISRAWTSISDAVPWKTGRRLVDQNARIGQRRSFAPGPACEQYGAHAGRHADARRPYLRLDEVHGVVDRKAGIDLSAGAVDVHLDVASGSSWA